MLELSGVSKTYNRGTTAVHAVRGVDLFISSGLFTIIAGPSGSGKSTLLYLMGCLDTPTAGEIKLGGRRLADLSSDARAELRAQEIGFVFQSFQQISNLSAIENVELPLLLGGAARKEARKNAQAALERVGLSTRLTHRPTELSGGELQRVAIARALINDPSLLLADEPTGNLDTESGERVISLIKGLKNGGRTPIIVTHNESFSAQAEFLVYMQDGMVVETTGAGRQEVRP